MATKRTFEENLALAKARGVMAKADPPPPVVAKQLSLELWPDAVRGVPNAVLRGALFGVSKVRETHKKRHLIAAVENQEIRYLGTRLNQNDLDLWEMLLHLARLQPLDTRVEFTAHSLLKALGRGTSGKHHEELKEDMTRLRAGTVEITWLDERKTFTGGLVSHFARDEDTGRYVVIFDAAMAELYRMGHTHIDWSQRQALGQSPLAKWLHGFYSSHVQPYGYKVETLSRLSGSTSVLREFRRMLKVGLEKLVTVGVIQSWEIGEDDLVKVKKVHTPTQARHIAKKTTRTKLAKITKKITRG
jgi:hypothetical protein